MDTRMITALYERLSRDDDVEGESNSMPRKTHSEPKMLLKACSFQLVICRSWSRRLHRRKELNLWN